jgi:hypothetical protein
VMPVSKGIRLNKRIFSGATLSGFTFGTPAHTL